MTLEAREALDSYSLVMGERFDSAPEYLIYGGVLFVPLNMNLIKRWGNDWSRSAPVNLLQARNEWSSPQRRQLVVALQVLAADVNLGYHDWRNWIVGQVNGVPIRDFNDFAERLASNKQANVVFENSNGYQMIINHAAAKGGALTKNECHSNCCLQSPYRIIHSAREQQSATRGAACVVLFASTRRHTLASRADRNSLRCDDFTTNFFAFSPACRPDSLDNSNRGGSNLLQTQIIIPAPPQRP